MESEKAIPVLFENERLIAVDKPSGLLVHAYKKETNERDHLLRRLKEQTDCYLYPVHRLDRPVSGIVLFGKEPEVVAELKSTWHDESTKKEYIALVKGEILEEGVFDFPLLNEQKHKQDAITQYKPLKVFKDVTLVSVNIKTGRKHQIRRHFSRRCANVIGDSKYGQGKINRHFREVFMLSRIFLHAHFFSIHPPTFNNPLEISCPIPSILQNVLTKLESNLLLD